MGVDSRTPRRQAGIVVIALLVAFCLDSVYVLFDGSTEAKSFFPFSGVRLTTQWYVDLLAEKVQLMVMSFVPLTMPKARKDGLFVFLCTVFMISVGILLDYVLTYGSTSRFMVPFILVGAFVYCIFKPDLWTSNRQCR